METLVKAGLYQSKPRLVLGDFNEIQCNSEKLGGPAKPEWQFSNFRRMLRVSGLHEVKTYGGLYTWIGNRSTGTVKSKLDRIVATADWKNQFPKALVQLLDWIGSDHRPLLLQTENNKWKGTKQFRYDNRWRFKQDLHMALQKSWDQDCSHLPPQRFCEALKRCRNSLSRWKSAQNLNSHKLIQQLHLAIQKANNLEPVLQHIQSKVTVEMNQQLTKPVSEGEIYQALSHMNVDKAPGPDGLNAGFYKYHWPTIKSANKAECQQVLQLLQLYANASGQHVNFQKSAILFGKSVPTDTQQYIKGLMGISRTGFGRYLGLPEAVANVARRNIKISPECIFCGEAKETTLHLLFHCRLAREIWELSPIGMRPEHAVFQHHPEPGNHEIQNYIEDILALAKGRYCFKFVGREENVMADNLAKQARQKLSPYTISWVY
ncbi:unnamed protein product [Arabidopsis arenosa]|uniref:Reverse transcriptase zinc-binding domain-containing protein n=1 Tax=Arabidopsis arenosa TaxID=38785 RepID=A0A8S1ZEP7_ARAAE|nr:unnamed protein product [Arabidopsis arenosa]